MEYNLSELPTVGEAFDDLKIVGVIVLIGVVIYFLVRKYRD